jgi:RHS repeat-associated protein
VRGSEVATFTYDGSLVTADARHGSLETTLSWGYDNDFRPTSFTYAGGTVSYGYDADSLLTHAADYAISHDASNGLPTAVSAPGFTLARGFSPYGELDDTTMTVAGTAAYGYSLTRDNSGRITSRTERIGGEARTLGYAYDLLGRLTTVTCGGDVVEAYRYDANGNRTHATVPARGVDSTMTFDTADCIATSAEATYTTDADGFVTSKETSAGTTTYRYSALGELTTVSVPSGHTITYAYDAFSRRVSRSVDGTLTDRYLWADATHLLAVYPAEGTTPTYRFAYADGRVPTSVETSAGTLRLLTDQVGTVRALVASDGTISSRVERDSYGAITSGTAGFPLGFAGGLEDADTGLVHFGAREYDPALGRWLSRDPIDFAGGDANLYGYVLGDPVGWVDPEGLETWGFSLPNMNIDGNVVVDGGAQQMFVWDDKGHFGIARTVNFIGYRTNVSVGQAFLFQHTSRDSICDLNGLGGEKGWSASPFLRVGPVGVGGGVASEYFWNDRTNRYDKRGTTVSIGGGASLSPVDYHEVVSYTWVQQAW